MERVESRLNKYYIFHGPTKDSIYLIIKDHFNVIFHYENEIKEYIYPHDFIENTDLIRLVDYIVFSKSNLIGSNNGCLIPGTTDDDGNVFVPIGRILNHISIEELEADEDGIKLWEELNLK